MTSPDLSQIVIDSPLGAMRLAASPVGLCGLWFVEEQKYAPAELAAAHRETPVLAQARAQLDAYWARRRSRFELPLDLQGTPFQLAVWQALLQIGSGSTATYSEIARQLGRPTASRAIGHAVGRNPVSIIVPCHRVLGRDGSLTGYAGGLRRKTALLGLEGVQLPSDTADLFAPQRRAA